MDQVAIVTNEIAATDDPVKDIDTALMLGKSLENFLIEYRRAFGGSVHPWAMPSLANAIGSIQSMQSHLRAAKHHIETPEPAIDASFEVVK